jgi:hypothetical protein
MARPPLKQFTPKITGNRAGIGNGKKISHDGLLMFQELPAVSGAGERS